MALPALHRVHTCECVSVSVCTASLQTHHSSLIHQGNFRFPSKQGSASVCPHPSSSVRLLSLVKRRCPVCQSKSKGYRQILQQVASDCHLSTAYGLCCSKSVRVLCVSVCVSFCAVMRVRCLEVYGPSIPGLHGSGLPLGPFLGLRGPRGPQADFP